MAVKLSPVFNEQVLDSSGAPASGWSIYTYAAGSTTPQTTYTDATGTIPQPNPIPLNALGYPSNPIWLTAGQTYKFVLKDDQGVTQKTIDNVSGINDTSVSISQWVSSGVTPTYVSASQFTLVGDQTTEFHVGRRLQLTVTAGTVYGVITASAYTTLTTVTVALDSGSLDAGLSAANLSILRADNPALPKSSTVLASMGAVNKAGDTMTGALNFAPAVSVASAATVDLGAQTSNNVTITGTTTITSLGTANAGIQRSVTFAASLLLTYNATSLILPSAANITTQAGDTATFVSLGSGNWRCLAYQQADGRAVNRPTSLSTASGSAPSYSDRAWGVVLNNGTASLDAGGNIASVSRLSAGRVQVSFTTAMPSSKYGVRFGANTADLATGMRSCAVESGSKTTSGFIVLTTYDGAPTTGQDANFDFSVIC